ncbi:hypothetical protein Q7P36_007716 [Cladosporium allicinum]
MGDSKIPTSNRYPVSQAVFSGQTASSSARQHNGNLYNNHNYNYTLAKRRSDETLREDGRNVELLRAAAGGQLPRVRHLLRIGANIDYRDCKDLTALHHAVLSGFEDVVGLLLDLGADVNAPSLSAGYPLCLAVLKDRSNIMGKLIEFRADANLADQELGTPLHCAAFTGSCKLAQFLLEHGADPDPVTCVDLPKLLPYRDSVSADELASQDPWTSKHRWTKITPLMIAVLANNLDLAALLFGTKGVKRPSAFTYDGDSECTSFFPLHAAARWGSSETMALTITHSAHTDLRDSDHETPLMGACDAGNNDNVRQLLQAKASLNLCDSNGATALIIASDCGFEDCLEEMINAGACLDLYDGKKNTALIYASLKGHDDCVRRLIKAGASSVLCDAFGNTALIWASWKGHDDCVRQLIEAGASLDVHDEVGDTALHIAAEKGLTQIAKLLLDAGASPDEVCKCKVDHVHFRECKWRPRDHAKPGSEIHPLFQAWDRMHVKKPEIRRGTQIDREKEMKGDAEKSRMTPTGWTRTPRRRN